MRSRLATPTYYCTQVIHIIVIAPDEMHSSAVLSLLCLFFVKSQLVGVGASVERDQSAPARTAPQQVGGV